MSQQRDSVPEENIDQIERNRIIPGYDGKQAMSLRMLFAIFASEILRFIFAPYNENRMPWREQSILKVSLIT